MQAKSSSSSNLNGKKSKKSWSERIKEKIFGSYEEEVIIEEDDTIVSTPFNVEHQIHVDFTSTSGFSVCQTYSSQRLIARSLAR
jgi:hypothetical protein